MTTILETIISQKQREIEALKKNAPLSVFKKQNSFQRTPNRIETAGPIIIAEFKRRSPSKGDISLHADVEEVTRGYKQAGAAAVSVLSDKHFFGAKEEDFTAARKALPDAALLRKDFIIDEHQLFESKAMGADLVLLLAAVLSKNEIKKLTDTAHDLGLSVLLEFYSEQEIEKYYDQADLVGINNRNLKTFAVDINHARRLLDALPPAALKISESGIENSDQAAALLKAGFNGLLIGELFMKTPNPAETCRQFIDSLKTKL